MKDVKFSAKKSKFGRILFYVMEDGKHLYQFNKIEDAAEWIAELDRRALIK